MKLLKKVKQIFLLPLLVLDCAASVVVGESFMNTLSAKAHDCAVKGQKYWKWTEKFIDGIFGSKHCKEAHQREVQFGSVWASWVDRLKND